MSDWNSSFSSVGGKTEEGSVSTDEPATTPLLRPSAFQSSTGAQGFS